jgi:anaerobic dimethyl sulfoxide reductase subunit A
MWGWNPAVGIRYGNESEYLARARARGTPVICIDPRFSDSAAVFAGRWIPIRPNTDTALLAALAHVMLREHLQDQAFLDRCTLGFERYRAYVLGEEDGVPKTPGWAEAITGVPVEITTALAREYAAAKPAALLDGFAPGRTAYGEQFHRSIMTLACMGGNVGVSGGYAGAAAFGGGHLRLGGLGPKLSDRLCPASNPVDAACPARPKSAFYQGAAKQPTSDWYLGGPSSARISRFFFADAILKGRAGGYPADYRLLYTVNVNYLNQYANSNKIARALRALEFFVTQEQFMTATARFADIILPTSTFLERNDITKGIEYYGLVNKAIEPPGECRSHLEIAGGLARRLGIEDFTEKTEEAWVREIAGGIEGADFTQFKRDAVHPVDRREPYVSFRDQARDPVRHPFATPSGKIEIYSQTIADMKDPLLPPIPRYIEAWEGRRDPLAARYPLQLVTTHTLRRAHTQNETVPWLRELYPQAITLNAADAAARGIRDGDPVRVSNDRGVMEIPARVTERILPGVVDLPQGAWYAPDERGVDRGGCANVLTKDIISPGGAFCSNTCLVQVEKA